MNTIVLIIVISLIIAGYYYNVHENWQDYKMLPFGEVKSGSDPLYFYNYNRYRLPYRWPFKHYSSYPYPHLEPLP